MTRAEQYVRDRQIDGWLLDLKTGEVHTIDGETFTSMIAFARHYGYKETLRERNKRVAAMWRGP
jgi:hypothetical protein